MKISKRVQGLISLLCVAGKATNVVGEEFTVFTGAENGASSWLDANLWPQFSGYPDGADDTATLDNADTYAVIDSSDVLVGGVTVAKTATNVELEVSSYRKLVVNDNVAIGEMQGSSGMMRVQSNSHFEVRGDLDLSGGGSGTLLIDGGIVQVNGALTVGSSSLIELRAGGLLIISGDQLDNLATYLALGKIMPNTGMQTYAVYDATNDKTYMRGPVAGVTRSISCPTGDEVTVVTSFNSGDTLDLGVSTSGQLCTLAEVNTAATSGRRMMEVSAAQLAMTPLGRSYGGAHWEAYGGAHSSLKFDCAQETCRVSLPVPANGRSYVLKAYTAPIRSVDNTKARFLEKSTFGPTKADINGFGSPESWLSDQFELPITSHRAVFRKHMTHLHSESNYNTLLHAGACNAGARYRRYAFVSVDNGRDLTITTNPASSKVTLKVDGELRSVVDGPVQCGDWKGPARNISDGTYELCWNPLDGVNGRVKVMTSNLCDCELFFGGIYGNPTVQFDEDNRPDIPPVSLDDKSIPVLGDRFYFSSIEDELLQVTEDLADEKCSNMTAPGAPATTVIGKTIDASGTKHWIHTTSFQLLNNDLASPLPDGGKAAIDLTTDAPNERMKLRCSSAPRTFLNEDSCVMSENACYANEGSDVEIHLTQENLETIWSATGGEIGTDTRYVYVTQGLRFDSVSVKDLNHPCTPDTRSRWIKVANCTSSRVISEQTRLAFETLLSSSSDINNEQLRDIYFPTAGTVCDPSDVNKNDAESFTFKISVDGQCFENTHPDNYQVFDYTPWISRHPGGADKIKDFANVDNSFVMTFPGTWHGMERWKKGRVHLLNVGREGDNTTIKNLPTELRREDVAEAFGSTVDAIAGFRIVCGSPFEVATEHSEKSATLYKGGFGMHTAFNFTNWGLDEQRRSIWLHIALNAEDQLRQRMAFALSQIVVVSADSITDEDLTESFLTFYDIFVRHAFGNYFDILKEVTYHPLMAEMLTYRDGQSTGFAWGFQEAIFLKPDENYAREIMQLFTIGLEKLNMDGTPIFDSSGKVMRTYTNQDITEYSKVYTGLRRRPNRGNMEGPSFGWDNNQVDPLYTDPAWKDHQPKLGLDGQYIGDGYPLCVDLPLLSFLKAGAKYRLMGSNPVPDLLNDPSQWWQGAPKRLRLNFENSTLASALCGGNTASCQPNTTAILSNDIECYGVECTVAMPRTIEVSEGVWFEYVRPACVNTAFYSSPKTIYRNWYSDRLMCGNPQDIAASTVCCGGDKGPWRHELFSGERVSYADAQQRCQSQGLELCNAWQWIQDRDCSDPVQGGCDQWNLWYWSQNDCTQYVKINLEGSVAVVHQHGAPGFPNAETYRRVRGDTKTFFGAEWNLSDKELGLLLEDYVSSCSSLGCFIDSSDGLCQCPVSVNTEMVFQSSSEVLSANDVLSKAKIGAFEPSVAGEVLVSGDNAVTMYPAGPITSETVFECTDKYGRTHYRKNLLSRAVLGNGDVSMRNPVSFYTLSEFTTRDAEYELDAALEQYFYHSNTAPFIAIRLAQRFGISNPSPVYVEAIAKAFTTGTYKAYGSQKYGCLRATIAAILLHQEALDTTLDSDPAQGSILEPYLKLVRIMRSLEFKPRADSPFVRFGLDIMSAIGQEAHKLPNVFSFFRPEYSPSGRITSAGLVSPESQVLHGPTSVNTLNLMFSLIKYGWAECYGGGGRHQVNKFGWAHTHCKIGDSTNWGENTYDAATSYGLTTGADVVDDLAMLLTSGRLNDFNRQILVDAYDFTIAQGRSHLEAEKNVQQLLVSTQEFQSTNVPIKSGSSRVSPETPPPTGIPYKNIVYVMLSGGADSFNMIFPDVCSGTNAANLSLHDQYLEHRGVMAFNKTEEELQTIHALGQPCSEFALHPELDFVKELYDQGDLLWVVNSGVVNQNGMTKSNLYQKTATQLFAHNAMQEETKKVDPYENFAGTGMLGRAHDVLQRKGHVINGLNIDTSAVTLDGVPGSSTPPLVIPSGGVNSFAERNTAEDYFDIEGYVQALNSETDGFSGVFGDKWSEVLLKGIGDTGGLKEVLLGANMSSAIWGEEPSNWEQAVLWRQLITVSKLAQTRGSRNSDRDAFYVEYGGFDHHNRMKDNLQPKMESLNSNLKKFVSQLKTDGIWENSVIVVTSEFARTITPNANEGSDHAYGQHVIVLGGSVKGGQVLGHYPNDISPQSPLDDGGERGRFLPTTSNDAIWNGILQWYGIADESELDYCLPNRHNTVDPVALDVLGGVSSPLLTLEDMFVGVETSEARLLRQRRQ